MKQERPYSGHRYNDSTILQYKMTSNSSRADSTGCERVIYLKCALLPYAHISSERKAGQLHLPRAVFERQAVNADCHGCDTLNAGESPLGAEDNLGRSRLSNVPDVRQTVMTDLANKVAELTVPARKHLDGHIHDIREDLDARALLGRGFNGDARRR